MSVCVCMYVWMDGRTDGWMDGCIRMDGWMDACMHACMERELGGPYHGGGEQGSGIRNHICMYIHVYIHIVYNLGAL